MMPRSLRILPRPLLAHRLEQLEQPQRRLLGSAAVGTHFSQKVCSAARTSPPMRRARRRRAGARLLGAEERRLVGGARPPPLPLRRRRSSVARGCALLRGSGRQS